MSTVKKTGGFFAVGLAAQQIPPKLPIYCAILCISLWSYIFEMYLKDSYQRWLN